MGKEEGLPDRLTEEDEAYFPHLADYQVTSPKTKHYNCIAHAAGDDTRWWEPVSGYYWPEGAEQGDALGALESCFKAEGFEVCDGCEPEAGFIKVALYRGADGKWTHAARQVDGGAWTSKLGMSVDIRHRTPRCVSGQVYGDVAVFMRRKA